MSTFAVTKAVLPAAGLGTRFLPATKSQPKEMLPIVDKPAIQYVVEEAVLAGLTDVLVITGRGKRAIEDHFDRNFELEHYLEQSGRDGLLAEMREINELADFHYMGAAVGSFLVAVTNNYVWNRLWTFHHQRGHVAYQGMRFLVVAVLALVANLIVLRVLVEMGVGKILAQAIAIVLVTPLNFVGNKLWSFGRR